MSPPTLPDTSKHTPIRETMPNIKIPTSQTSIFTFSQTIDPGFGDPVDMVATIPSLRPQLEERNKIAIMLVLGPEGSEKIPMGCYIYTVYDPKRNDTIQTIFNNSEESLLDMTKKLGTVITKKYQTPSYVCINGGVDITTFLGIIKGIVDSIEDKYAHKTTDEQ